MIKICLTGNIGSGKTYVSKVFEDMGFPVYQADEEARKFFALPEVIDEIRSAFGEHAIQNGMVDIQFLAQTVFVDNIGLGKLNSIIHPRVMADFDAFCERRGGDSCIMESAIVFEYNLDHHFHSSIFVSAPFHMRMKRVMLRDKASEEMVKARMSKQWSDEVKAKKADYVIINDGNHLILPQISEILNTIKKK